ncbi:Retrotransposon Gag-Pol polyprotein [Diutina catenulata]
MAKNDKKFSNGSFGALANDPEVRSQHDEADISSDPIQLLMKQMEQMQATFLAVQAATESRMAAMEQHYANLSVKDPAAAAPSEASGSTDSANPQVPLDSVGQPSVQATTSAMHVPTHEAAPAVPEKTKGDFGFYDNPFAGRLPRVPNEWTVSNLVIWLDACSDLVREAEINNTDAKLKYQLDATIVSYVRLHNPTLTFDPTLRVREYVAKARSALMDSHRMFEYYVAAIDRSPLKMAILHNNSWFDKFSITLTELSDDIRYMSPTKAHAIGNTLFAHRHSLSMELKFELLQPLSFFNDCNMRTQETISAQAPGMITSVVRGVTTIRDNLPRRSYGNNSSGNNSYGNNSYGNNSYGNNSSGNENSNKQNRSYNPGAKSSIGYSRGGSNQSRGGQRNTNLSSEYASEYVQEEDGPFYDEEDGVNAPDEEQVHYLTTRKFSDELFALGPLAYYDTAADFPIASTDTILTDFTPEPHHYDATNGAPILATGYGTLTICDTKGHKAQFETALVPHTPGFQNAADAVINPVYLLDKGYCHHSISNCHIEHRNPYTGGSIWVVRIGTDYLMPINQDSRLADLVHRWCQVNGATFLTKPQPKVTSAGALWQIALRKDPQDLPAKYQAYFEVYRFFHTTLGHVGFEKLRRTIRDTYGIQIPKNLGSYLDCMSCIRAKKTRKNFTHLTVPRQPLDVVYADVCDVPVPAANDKGVTTSPARKFAVFVDVFTQFYYVAVLDRKSEVLSAFRKFVLYMERQSNRPYKVGTIIREKAAESDLTFTEEDMQTWTSPDEDKHLLEIKTLVTDGGLEFNNQSFDEICWNRGIDHKLTCAYTPEQNGPAERLNRTILNDIRVQLAVSGLPDAYWPHAAVHSANIRNHTTDIRSIGGLNCSPWTAITGRPPEQRHYHPFGCLAAVVDTRSTTHKLKPRGELGVYLGLSDRHMGYKVLKFKNREIVHIRDVELYPTVFPLLTPNPLWATRPNDNVTDWSRFDFDRSDVGTDTSEDYPEASLDTSIIIDSLLPGFRNDLPDKVKVRINGQEFLVASSPEAIIDRSDPENPQIRTELLPLDAQSSLESQSIPFFTGSVTDAATDTSGNATHDDNQAPDVDMTLTDNTTVHDVGTTSEPSSPLPDTSSDEPMPSSSPPTLAEIPSLVSVPKKLATTLVDSQSTVALDSTRQTRAQSRRQKGEPSTSHHTAKPRLPVSFKYNPKSLVSSKRTPTVRRIAAPSTPCFDEVLKATHDAAETSVVPTHGTHIPKNYHEAVKIPEVQEACQRELDAHRQAGSWSQEAIYTDDPDMLRNALWTHWIFTTKDKFEADGTCHMVYKSRLVIRGDRQTPATYDETFAPTLTLEMLRLFLVFALEEDMELYQTDVDTAFLNAEIDSDIFIRVPAGLSQDYPRQHGKTPLLRLRKAVYGLKQSSRLWYQCLHNFLLSNGFVDSAAADSLYVRVHDGRVVVALAVFVDDIVIAARSTFLRDETLDLLRSRFGIKDLGPPRSILKINLTIRPDEIYMDKCKYIDEIAAKFSIVPGNRGSPLPPNWYFHPSRFPLALRPSLYKKRVHLMRSMIGCLNHLATTVRPDISYAVSQLAKYVTYPHDDILEATRGVMAYLVRTRDLRLRFVRDRRTLQTMYAYCDASFQTDVTEVPTPELAAAIADGTPIVKPVNHSTLGQLIYKCGPIMWRVLPSSIVCNSVAEAELCALYHLNLNLIWLSKGLHFLRTGQDLPDRFGQDHVNQVFTDSKTTVDIVHGDKLTSSRSRHFENRLDLCLEQYRQGMVELHHIPGVENPADLLTKPAAVDTYNRLRPALFDFKELPHHA